MNEYVQNTISNLKEYKKNDFIRSLFLIAGGTAFAQALGSLVSPIISRIYTPEEFGILTVYASMLALFAGSQSLRYERGIPIADDDESAINILSLSVIILLLLTIIITVFITIWGEWVLKLLSSEVIFIYRYLIPIGFLLYGLYQILMMWNFREKDYKAISKTKLYQSISSNISKILLGVIGLGPLGLIISRIISESSGITTLSQPLISNKRYLFKKITRRRMIFSAKRYIRFPQYQLPSTFLSKFADQVPILFIASLYGGSIVGLFGFAKQLVNIPMALIGTSLGDVYYGEAASIGKKDPEKLKVLSITIAKKIFFIGLFPFIIFLIFAPHIFSFVFGDTWIVAGEFARILALLSFSQIVFQPTSRIFDIFEKQNILFNITLLRIALVLISFFISKVFMLGYLISISIYTFIMVMIYAISYFISLDILNQAIDEANSK